MEDNLGDARTERVLARMAQVRRVQEMHGLLFREISSLLYRHDPIGLAAFDAPEDEYDLQAGTIILRLGEATSPAELCIIIHEEFVQWIDLRTAGPAERYTEIADEVWAAWRRYTAQ